MAFFAVQSGFAMVCAGAIRKKNMQNSMLKNLVSRMALAAVLRWQQSAF